jgi:hypothetical protein
MVQGPSGLKRFFRILAICFVGMALLVVTFKVSWSFFEKRAERNGSDIKKSEFPVVLVSPVQSKIIYANQIQGYLREEQYSSMLIYEGNLELVKKQLERPDGGQPSIAVKDISKDRQLIELETHGEGLFFARYEATQNDVTPLTLKMSGPLFVMYPALVSLFFAIAGGFAVHFLLRAFEKKNRIS